MKAETLIDLFIAISPVPHVVPGTSGELCENQLSEWVRHEEAEGIIEGKDVESGEWVMKMNTK